jgi:hypothetical protein
MRSMPSGFNIGDRASVYTRAPCQLDLRPSQPFACRLYVRAFHSFNVYEARLVEGVFNGGWLRRIVRRDPPLNEPNDRVAPMARHF